MTIDALLITQMFSLALQCHVDHDKRSWYERYYNNNKTQVRDNRLRVDSLNIMLFNSAINVLFSKRQN